MLVCNEYYCDYEGDYILKRILVGILAVVLAWCLAGCVENDRITIGETQIFNDNAFGNLEVTLDYVEFVNRVDVSLFGAALTHYPDEGNVYLRAALTIKNIGTSSGSLPGTWSRVVYDGVYKFTDSIDDLPFDIKPLTTAKGSIAFMIPNIVAQSDGELVLVFDDGSWVSRNSVSFVVRRATGNASVNQGHGTTKQTSGEILHNGSR